MPNAIPPTGADVLPSTDADFALFCTQFAAAWVPATFNVVLPTAASLVTLASDFATALAVASDPTTRTPVSIAEKEAERVTAAGAFRNAIRAGQAAYLAATASEAALNNLGIRANSLIRTPVAAPVFAPIVNFDGALTGQNRMRITQVDPATGIAVTTRKYALGISGVQVQRKIGAGEWLSRFTSKRTKLFDSTTDLSPGTVTLYRCRYVTARGLSSPWSASTSGVAA